MKTLIVALALAGLAAAPAMAQDLETYTEEEVAAAQTAIDDAELSDDLHKHFWCGAAFIVLGQVATTQGDSDTAAQAQAFGDSLFGKAATEAIELGVPEEDFTAMAQNFRILVFSQTAGGEEADYTQDECAAAAE